MIRTSAYLSQYDRQTPNYLTVYQKHSRYRLNNRLIWGVWIYFLLVIFEGALRKWFLPALATPLLVIRDPIAIWLVIYASTKKLMVVNGYIAMLLFIGILGTITAVLVGHGSIFVALYGARIFLIHLPAMFAIGVILNRQDVEKIGHFTLWLTPPMTLLIALQFNSPQSAWVNRGVGGDLAGAGFGGALGYFRPPGTFSFTNGTTLFFSMAACFIFYYWLNSKSVNKLLLIASTMALLVAIPLSISRGLFFQVLVSVGFMLVTVARKPKFIGRLLFSIIGIFILFYFLNTTGIFQTSTEVFLARFNDANETEGGLNGVLVDRFLGGMYNALIESPDLPFLGYGIGIGSNVGSQLLTGGRIFLLTEQEWGRIIGELGPILGLLVIFLRVKLTINFAFSCYKKLLKGDLLPWMILSFGSLIILQGQWAQPTALGFCTLTGGLLLASLQQTKQK